MSRFTIVLSPGARESEIVGPYADGWKARVAAPAARGRANAALVELLADTLDVARDRVRILAGSSSRRKVVEVEGLGAAEIERRLSG